MSGENVEIVRRAIEAFNRAGTAGAVSSGLYADDVEWDGTRSGVPGAGVERGIDDVVAFFEENWFAAFPFEDWEIHIEEAIDNGDKVVFTSHQRARGASERGGESLALGSIFTLRNGQIVRMQVFQRPEDARKAAGPTE